MFFELGTAALFLLLTAIMLGVSGAGMAIGTRLRGRSEEGKNSVGVVQGALLGLVGLMLALGLTMSVGRYEDRRVAVVQEANAIGTTYLRAQLLAEPQRSSSLELLREYADSAVDLAQQVPDSTRFRTDQARIGELQSALWAEAGAAVEADPQGTAPRLYIETLNEMIDANGVRVASLGNRVPDPVTALQVIGSAFALAVLALYLSMMGRGALTSLVAATVVILMVFVSFDLDRPQRGLITIPSNALKAARAQMDGPPAFNP